MPIYEYRCGGCKRRVSLFYQTFSAAENATTRVCPQCKSTELTKLVSRVFQLKGEDARLEELSDPSSLGDLDEDDPKSVARWARKLGREMGEDLGDDWDEMVDRMEAGEEIDGPDGAPTDADAAQADL